MLKEKATNVERRQLAETGILRCAFLLRDDVETIHAATDLLVEPKLSPELRNEALYYRAKAYTNQKAGKKAMDDYRELAKDTRNPYGAEAKYQVAQGLYDAKEYAAAEKELLNYIEQSTPHAYWLALQLCPSIRCLSCDRQRSGRTPIPIEPATELSR